MSNPESESARLGGEVDRKWLIKSFIVASLAAAMITAIASIGLERYAGDPAFLEIRLSDVIGYYVLVMGLFMIAAKDVKQMLRRWVLDE